MGKTFRNSASSDFEEEKPDAVFEDETDHATTKTEWRLTRGATRAYRDVFRECSEGFRLRGTWVMKSFDGFIEFGLADTNATQNTWTRSTSSVGTWPKPASTCDATSTPRRKV